MYVPLTLDSSHQLGPRLLGLGGQAGQALIRFCRQHGDTRAGDRDDESRASGESSYPHVLSVRKPTSNRLMSLRVVGIRTRRQEGEEMMTLFQEARRELSGVTSPVERRVLAWLAVRMPERVNADHLTALALAAMMLAGLSYWAASREPAALLLASLCLAVNWFGDSLDGTLARVRQQQRPRYGFYIDHVVDAVGVSALLGGMALSSLMDPRVALGVLAAYHLVSIEVCLATYCLGTFRISVGGFGPTELRLLLALGNVVMFLRPDSLAFGRWPPFDLAGVVAIVVMVLIGLGSMTVHGLRLARLEPRPCPSGR